MELILRWITSCSSLAVGNPGKSFFFTVGKVTAPHGQIYWYKDLKSLRFITCEIFIIQFFLPHKEHVFLSLSVSQVWLLLQLSLLYVHTYSSVADCLNHRIAVEKGFIQLFLFNRKNVSSLQPLVFATFGLNLLKIIYVDFTKIFGTVLTMGPAAAKKMTRRIICVHSL